MREEQQRQPTNNVLTAQPTQNGELGTHIGTVLIKNRPKTDPKGGRALN